LIPFGNAPGQEKSVAARSDEMKVLGRESIGDYAKYDFSGQPQY